MTPCHSHAFFGTIACEQPSKLICACGTAFKQVHLFDGVWRGDSDLRCGHDCSSLLRGRASRKGYRTGMQWHQVAWCLIFLLLYIFAHDVSFAHPAIFGVRERQRVKRERVDLLTCNLARGDAGPDAKPRLPIQTLLLRIPIPRNSVRSI
jgi:hypothetical protein